MALYTYVYTYVRTYIHTYIIVTCIHYGVLDSYDGAYELYKPNALGYST